MSIFTELESSVVVYARAFPTVFSVARDEFIHDVKGNIYLDFFAGAGSLNYGHNNTRLKSALLDYIRQDGIVQGLDFHTSAKARFMETFLCHVLRPRGLDYRLQFTGPTGANAVEAALKLARKVTGRQNVAAFTNGFHGGSLGAVAATGNRLHRVAAGVPLNHVTRLPFCGYYGQGVDTLAQFRQQLSDPSSGLDLPAAVIVEVIQGEGGLNVADDDWLRDLHQLCQAFGMLLIVDDIQAGCGRSGTFFSFERAGIRPDIVTLSKSLSGYGLPMSMVMMAPTLDQWAPGEHNGTFRGNNHAFVTAASALEQYWSSDLFMQTVQRKATILQHGLAEIVARHLPAGLMLKGRGMMQGISCPDGVWATRVSRAAFARGMIIETAGNHGQVVKCLPPLTISEDSLRDGLERLAESFDEVMMALYREAHC